MSDLFKNFLLEDPRRLSPSGRYVALAAFGKHPGWDDHVEDLGLETASLNVAKTVLYINGIGGQIDSGAWEKLDATQQLPAFKHLFLWQRSGQILVGRLWSSSDGKGRKRYPMVVCLHFAGVTLGWALKQALPALAELEEQCTRTTSADDVRSLLNRKRSSLRGAVQSTDGRGEYAPVSSQALHEILQPAGSARREGFLRVLYQIRSQFATFNTRADTATVRAQQIRVPVAATNPEQSLLFWARFFLTQLDPEVPLLITVALEADWVDVTAGEPESHEFFCLRASPKAVPLASQVPYQIDDAFRATATAFLEGFQRGETTLADFRPAVGPAAEPTPPGRSRWLKWFGLGVVLISGAVAAIALLPRIGTPRAETNLAVTNVETSTANAGARPTNPAAPAEVPTNSEAARTKARLDAEAEAARLVEEKRQSDAMAAAAKTKAEAEAAAKEKEREQAELARIAKEQEEARQKELEQQQRKAAEAAATEKKAAEEAKATPDSVTVSSSVSTERATPAVVPVTAGPMRAEMTNSIGMVLVPMPTGKWASTKVWAGKYEVTQAEYREVMGTNPSKSVGDRRPVERVTWYEAKEFCRKMTEREQGRLSEGKVYTLPTENQWHEFLGGQKFEDLPGGGLSGKDEPALVGLAGPPNKFGLFDVLGNVWEWCLDGAAGGERLLKGGSFNSNKYDRRELPDVRSPECGFRCVIASQ